MEISDLISVVVIVLVSVALAFWMRETWNDRKASTVVASKQWDLDNNPSHVPAISTSTLAPLAPSTAGVVPLGTGPYVAVPVT